MENFISTIESVKERKFDITDNSKGKNLQQTQRNNLKNELLASIFADLKAKYEYTFLGKDGILVEIANDSVADNVSPDDCGSGAITVVLDLTIKSLDTSAVELAEDYAHELAEKEKAKNKKAEEKAKKIAKDKAERAKKKGE